MSTTFLINVCLISCCTALCFFTCIQSQSAFLILHLSSDERKVILVCLFWTSLGAFIQSYVRFWMTNYNYNNNTKRKINRELFKRKHTHTYIHNRNDLNVQYVGKLLLIYWNYRCKCYRKMKFCQSANRNELTEK